MINYDVLIIGGGPGGYVAAGEAAKQGKTAAVIEKQAIGGTCLNSGCIPAKNYVQYADWLLNVAKANDCGMTIQVEKIDFSKLVDRKDKVVDTLKKGILASFKASGIDFIEGEAVFVGGTTFKVGDQELSGQDVILATGGHPIRPDIKGLANTDYYTTDNLFQLTELPQKMVTLGGNFMALELAYAFQVLGVEVTLITEDSDIIPEFDRDARKIINRSMRKLGLNIITGVAVAEIKNNTVFTAAGDVHEFDALFVAAGREANLDLARSMNVDINEESKTVTVDATYQTSTPHVYAIGDIIAGYCFAHSASAEGIKAVRAMAGKKESPVNQNGVPRKVYVSPEAVEFGMSVTEAKANGYDAIVKQMPYSYSGAALAHGDTLGFVKIISEKQHNHILGAVVVGNHAAEIIAAILTTYNSEGTVDQLSQTLFAHPTLPELINVTASSMIG